MKIDLLIARTVSVSDYGLCDLDSIPGTSRFYNGLGLGRALGQLGSHLIEEERIFLRKSLNVPDGA